MAVPSARTVFLKGLDERGFIFFTNYDSRKGRELAENPNAALVFYWQELERQVCIAGAVNKTSREESENYFKSRPHGSRLAAWASNQSEVGSRPRGPGSAMAGTGKEIRHGHSVAAELGRFHFETGAD